MEYVSIPWNWGNARTAWTYEMTLGTCATASLPNAYKTISNLPFRKRERVSRESIEGEYRGRVSRESIEGEYRGRVSRESIEGEYRGRVSRESIEREKKQEERTYVGKESR